MNLGDFLKQKRDELGLSNDDLAQAAGVDVSTLGQILAGDIICPPDARLRGLAERLGVTFEELIDLVPRSRQDPETVTQGTASNSVMLTYSLALNQDGSVPDWIELLPPGPVIRGKDGRTWRHDNPAELIANQTLPIPLDWEHATELKAPKGEQAPAAAWIEELQLRDGATWGRVAWNAAGQASVASREYRFISPVFLYEKQSLRVLQLASAALTNRPNLPLQALNRQKELLEAMDPDTQILNALGLAEGARVTDVVTAINALKAERESAKAELALATNRADTPDLTKFVPRADYDAAVERATNAEQTLQAQADVAREAEIEAAINAALDAGKIAPASVDYHKAACAEDGGLDRFKAFVDAAPKLLVDSGLDDKEPPDANRTLTADEKALCQQMGLDEAEYLQMKGSEHATV